MSEENSKKQRDPIVNYIPLLNLIIKDKQYSFLFPHGSSVEELEEAVKGFQAKLDLLRVEITEAKKAQEAKEGSDSQPTEQK